MKIILIAFFLGVLQAAPLTDLQKIFLEDPTNASCMVPLAQEYYGAKQYPLALEIFEKRISLGKGPVNEITFSLYCIALLQEEMGMTPAIFMKSYENAFFHRQKAEPLFRLANHHTRSGSHLIAYVLLKHAISLPLPTNNDWMDGNIYGFNLFNAFAHAAFMMGKSNEAIDMFTQILQNPDLPNPMHEQAFNQLAYFEEQSRSIK